VQQTLKQDGMYHSRVDGVWGPASQAALRDYQQQHNMNATGQLDQQTLASLNLGNNNGPNYSSSSQYTPQSSNAGSPNYGSANQNPNNQGAQPMSPGTPGQRAQNAQSNQQGGSSTH
jgi:peptidoglycan hydrolase-like protein with peptidoglycan-binding domain